MIIDSFDDSSPALIEASMALKQEMIQKAKKYVFDSFIITFSHKLIDELVKKEVIESIDEEIHIGTAAMQTPIYRIKESDIGVFLSGVGAPVAVSAIEELHALFNCEKYVVFGSCGALDKIAEGKLIVPEMAYRDEGTSYHYTKAADYIKIKNADKLSMILDELNVDHVKGKIWSTDGFYRETRNNLAKRKSEGCICVDMECSALQAICDFKGLKLYQFVYSADYLGTSWQRRILGNMEMDARLSYFLLAQKIAEKIHK